MSQVQFFPSRRIALYMGKAFLIRSIAVLAALVVILQTLDLLGETSSILAHPGNGDAQLWHYVWLRVPQIVARFLPFSVLLGTLITLATLNQNSEVIAMKAAGISAHQILAPLVLVSIAIAAISFTFNERVVTRATATLNAWQAVDYGPIPKTHDGSTNIWVRDGDDIIHADAAHGRGNATTLDGVTLYDRAGNRLHRIVTAASGRRVAQGWELQQVRTFLVGPGTVSTQPSMIAFPEVRPDRFTLADVDADERSIGSLAAAIRELKAAGRPTAPLEAGMWHKISGALLPVLMPLLGGVAAFGLARSGALFVRAVIGMALGFAYFVADSFALAMGNLGAYPPFLAAWAPFLLFLLIGEAVLIRTEE